jgi:hypothetical protein
MEFIRKAIKTDICTDKIKRNTVAFLNAIYGLNSDLRRKSFFEEKSSQATQKSKSLI